MKYAQYIVRPTKTKNSQNEFLPTGSTPIISIRRLNILKVTRFTIRTSDQHCIIGNQWQTNHENHNDRFVTESSISEAFLVSGGDSLVLV